LLARLKDRSKEDEADYLQAIAEQEALIQKPAATVEQRRELARYLNNLGNLQSGSRRDDAEKTFRKALQIQDEIEAQSASSAGFRWQRARTWNNLATLLLNLRRYDEADPFFARAKQAFEALEADFPTVPDYHRELAMSLNNYGLLLNARPSKTTNPIDLFRQAEADQRRLATEYPEVPDHKIRLSVTCLNLGDRLRTTDPVEADARFLEGIAIQEKLTTDFPQVPEYQAALGRTLTLRAALLADQNKRADAVVLLDQAIPALEKARQGNPREQNYRVFVYDAHDQKGKNLAILGRAAELAIEADQLTKAIPDRPDSYLQAANFLAKAAELAGSDANQAETYAKSAVKALRDALDKGANDPAILDRVDLKSLRNRPDFQKLRDDWNTKGKKATV
jgi:tetratricopeptide (TPR) repeat protein